MTQLSMNEMTTYRWTFAEDVTRFVEHGISAIGVWRRKLSDFGEERGIEMLADSGLAVSNLMWAGGFTGSDGRSVRESIDDAEEAISLAAAMRARCLVVFTGGHNGHTRNHARRIVHEALRELEPVASDFGVTLAVEPMHAACSYEWTIVTGIEDALSFIDELGSSQIRLALDTCHVGYELANYDLLAKHAERIAVVHLNDSKWPPDGDQNSCRLGEGTASLEEIVQVLKANGYRGDFDVKLMGEEIEITDYDQLIEHSIQAFETLSGIAVST